ncbi:MAG: exopolyphosphatase [Caulobacteraceae bacterium]|nr:exopolyphosphatase [Caulobacteraceae bacterium]
MSETANASGMTTGAVLDDARSPADESTLYAALDLGTNNCRLLIAARHTQGFRIVDAYSRIVRLGEGVSQSGRLGEAAMERAIGALRVCADKIRRRGVAKVRAVATQACRSAVNGDAFIAAVAERTGLRLEVITPREEAQLAVAGCLDLLDRRNRAALVLDVGGGSTELSWIDLSEPGLNVGPRRVAHRHLPIKAWQSTPLGVVTLAERFPDVGPDDKAGYRRMVEAVKAEMGVCAEAEPFHDMFAAGQAHIVGTSGAITSLAGLHLGLRRYDRAKVDGLWMTRAECEAVATRLIALSIAQRAAEPCIGPDRADLVLAGAAILQAVQELWPSERVRVADRGLREGLLLSLMASGRAGRPRRRRGGRGGRRT